MTVDMTWIAQGFSHKSKTGILQQLGFDPSSRLLT